MVSRCSKKSCWFCLFTWDYLGIWLQSHHINLGWVWCRWQTILGTGGTCSYAGESLAPSERLLLFLAAIATSFTEHPLQHSHTPFTPSRHTAITTHRYRCRELQPTNSLPMPNPFCLEKSLLHMEGSARLSKRWFISSIFKFNHHTLGKKYCHSFQLDYSGFLWQQF